MEGGMRVAVYVLLVSMNVCMYVCMHANVCSRVAPLWLWFAPPGHGLPPLCRSVVGISE